jgi:ribonuclease P protein component
MAAPTLPLRLRREQRIQQTRDFQRAKLSGQRLAVGCLALNWMEASAAGSRLGVITSKRIGSAVVRTRARRLLREAFRLHQHEIARPADMVLVARLSIVGKSFADVERDYLTALRRAKLLKEL